MKKRQLFLILLISSISVTMNGQNVNYSTQITTLTTSILTKTSHLNDISIGTVDFTNMDDEVTALGKLLAEEVSGEMNLQNSKLTIIDRNRINYWMKKEGVQVSDLSNPEIAERISEKASIELVLMGNITPFGDKLRLNLKVLNLKTGEVVAYERGELQQNKTFQSLMNVEIKPAAIKEEFTEKVIPQRYNDYTETTGVPTKSTDYNPKDASNLPHKTEINNLEFKLRACKRSANMVSVFFTITNKSGDITLKIDDNDVIIHADEIDQLALTNFRFNQDVSIYIERDLTTGTPVQLQLIFNNVPHDLTTIDRLVIDYYAGRKEQIELQNIEIE